MNFMAKHKPSDNSPHAFAAQNNGTLEQVTIITFEEALAIVNNLVADKIGRELSEAEITVVKGAWNDCGYEEIAENSPYSINYLQRRLAPQLWDILTATIGNGERVYKKNLRDFLEQIVTRKYHTQSTVEQKQSVPKNFAQIIGTQLPDITRFYGRSQELSYLKKSIHEQRCISLIGVPGVGKSALAAKLVTELSAELQPHFDYFIWKPVSHAPVVHELVAEIIELIQPIQLSSDLPESTQSRITLLLKYLQSRRCLIVLDEFDALFENNNLAQKLEYRILFRRIVEEQFQSCLLLTGRVLPNELDSLIKAKQSIYYLKIRGLDLEASLQFLDSLGVNEEQKAYDLITTYSGNPRQLETAVENINYFFSGKNETFFENQTTFINSEFEAMLDKMFSQVLNEIQRQIMIYIADNTYSNDDCVSFTDILNGINQKYETTVSTSELIKALEKLEKFSLIESSKNTNTGELNFSIQRVIKKYIKTDPLGLVHFSKNSSQDAVAS